MKKVVKIKTILESETAGAFTFIMREENEFYFRIYRVFRNLSHVLFRLRNRLFLI